MKRLVGDMRTRRRRSLSEHGKSEELRYRRSQTAVVPLCFTSEPEESEGDEGAKDRSPSSDLV